jgi:lipoprotein NlpI
MDSNRCDILGDIIKAYEKMKKNAEAASAMQEKILKCKGATVADYFNLGRYLLFNAEYMRADSAFAKVNELSPTYASGFLWRAKANSYIDSTMTLGLAKTHYEKYIE